MKLLRSADVAHAPARTFTRAVHCLLPACFAVIACSASAPPAHAQSPHMYFVLNESELPEAIRLAGSEFENVWNSLLTTEIRASLAAADSAVRLRDLERKVAAEEPGALGSSIAGDAMKLRAGWSRTDLRRRLAAHDAEELAVAARNSGAFLQADSLFDVARRHYERLREARRLAWVWGSLGQNAFISGRFARADSLYRKALAARRAIGDEPMVGNSLNALGSTSLRLGRVEDAYGWYQQARIVRERTGQTAQLGQTLNFLGVTSKALGRPDSAAVWYRRALDLTVSSGDSTRTTQALINYAAFRRDEGDPGEAMALYERAGRIAREAADAANAALIEQNVGEILLDEGRYTEAVERFERAVELSAQASQPVNRANHLNSLGKAWLGIRDTDRARAALVRALALTDTVEVPSVKVLVLNNLALASFHEEDWTGAGNHARAALDAAHALGDSAYVRETARTLGRIAFQSGEFDDARSWFTRAAVTGELLGGSAVIEDQVNLGAVASRQSRADDAAAHFQRANEAAEDANRPDYLWAVQLGLGDVRERSGDVPGALAHYRRAASLIDTVRSLQGESQAITAFGSRLWAYETLIHLLTSSDAQYPDSGFAAEAFGWAERARARSLLDLLASSGRTGQQVATLSLAGAQALVGEDQALLAYSLGDSSSSLWVVTKREWKHVRLSARSAVHTRASVFRRNLARADRADSRSARRAGRALYRMLVEPAQEMLRGKTHLIIAPDGVLALIPFEAMIVVDVLDEDRPLPKKARLIERFAVSYTPSSSALAATRGAPRGGGIVALGDPLFVRNGEASARGDLVPLPNTSAELAAIQQSARNREMNVLVGAQATRSRLLSEPALADAQVIHLATHGEANESDPARSGLWLAAEEDGPGFLGVPDILGLDLHASLVALSACETGLGRLERGEGVLGLSRAFMAAGAQSVVVSLWKVNDASTARLMSRFYERMLRKKDTRSAALADAKRELIKREETRSPFHWASFVMVGADGALR